MANELVCPVEKLLVFQGVTTANGAALGASLVSAQLVGKPDFFGAIVEITSGVRAVYGQSRVISATTAAGVIVPDHNFDAQILVGTKFAIWAFIYPSGGPFSSIGKPNIETVEIYPVAPAASVVNSVLDSDGTTPLYAPVPAHSTASNDPLVPGVAWTQAFDFEQAGTVFALTWSIHLEWQTQFTVGMGAGTNSLSKVQMSIDGGTTWLDVTDLFTNPNAAMTPRTREGQRLFAAGIAVGATKLRFRLVHYTDDAGGVSTSQAQIRENCRINLTYRKA